MAKLTLKEKKKSNDTSIYLGIAELQWQEQGLQQEHDQLYNLWPMGGGG